MEGYKHAMASFSVYWPAEVVDRLPEDGPGPRLRVLYGGPHQSMPSFRRARVEVGDRLYPVTVRQRVLHVLGSLLVREILEVDELDDERGGWPARFPEWDFLARTCTNEVIVGSEGTPVRRDRPVAPDVVLDWTFLNRRGERPLRRVDPDGRILSADGLQGIYELHPETADALHGIVGRGLAVVPG